MIDTHLIDATFDTFPELKEVYVNMQPMGRMGEPKEISDAVLWLCSDSSTLMNAATWLLMEDFLLNKGLELPQASKFYIIGGEFCFGN